MRYSLSVLVLLKIIGEQGIIGNNPECPNWITQPETVVQAEGVDAVFECLCPDAQFHLWILNGTVHDEILPLPSDLISESPQDDIPVKLIFPGPVINKYNNTVVQCEATVVTPPTICISENAFLLVQEHMLNGLMVSIRKRFPTGITISWDPPFSLDLTTAEPDIQYCVDVYTESGDHLESTCDIIETSYTYHGSLNSDSSIAYTLTVTPRSNVEGSMNGTSVSVPAEFCTRHPDAFESLSVETNVDLQPVIVTYTGNGLNDDLCTILSTNVEFNGSEDESTNVFNCTITEDIIQGNSRSFSLNSDCNVERHTRYHVIVYVELVETEEYNQIVKSDAIEFSTHDVQKPEGGNLSPGQLDYSCSYLGNTVDKGVFAIIVYSPSEPIYRIAIRENSTSTDISRFSVDGLTDTSYAVISYDIEPNGMPYSVPAATPLKFSVNPSTITQGTDQFSDGVTVTPDNIHGLICINCLFSSATLTGCVGVIHSAQLGNLTLTVLAIDSSGREKCTHSGALSEGDYYVAVFNDDLSQSPLYQTLISVSVDSELPPTNSQIAGIVIATIVMLLVIVLTAVIIVAVFYKKLAVRNRIEIVELELNTNNHNQGTYKDISGDSSSFEKDTETCISDQSTNVDSVQTGSAGTSEGTEAPTYLLMCTADSTSENLEAVAKIHNPDQRTEAENRGLVLNKQKPDSHNAVLNVQPATRPQQLPAIRKHEDSSLHPSLRYSRHISNANLGPQTDKDHGFSDQHEQDTKILSGGKLSAVDCMRVSSAGSSGTTTFKNKQAAEPKSNSIESHTDESSLSVVFVSTSENDLKTDEEQKSVKVENPDTAEDRGFDSTSTTTQEDLHAPKADHNGVDLNKEKGACDDSEVQTQPQHNHENPSLQVVIQAQMVTTSKPANIANALLVFRDIGHTFAHKWYDFGEALCVPDEILDQINQGGGRRNDQTRLKEVIEAFFNTPGLAHTWDKIVKALQEIGEPKVAANIKTMTNNQFHPNQRTHDKIPWLIDQNNLECVNNVANNWERPLDTDLTPANAWNNETESFRELKKSESVINNAGLFPKQQDLTSSDLLKKKDAVQDLPAIQNVSMCSQAN